MQKLKLNDKVDQFQIRTPVYNIETATYNLARHFTKVLSPLSKSKDTIDSTKHLMEKKTIDITLERIYDCKEIDTQITRPDMKELLTLCTKNVNFTYDNQVYP